MSTKDRANAAKQSSLGIIGTFGGEHEGRCTNGTDQADQQVRSMEV